MNRTVLVIVEHRRGALRQVSLECLAAAQALAGSGGRVVSAVLGDAVGPVLQALGTYPHDEIVMMAHEQLARYHAQAHFAAIQQVIADVQPNAVILGHTAIGRDLAPQIAAHLQAGQVSDVIDIRYDADDVRLTRPIYAGKAFEQRRFTQGPWVITVRPNNLPGAQADASAQVPVRELAYTPPSDLRTTIRDVVEKTAGAVDLTEAKIIVSGGRGVKSAEGFRPLLELADVLGAAIGASRGACDAGYCDYSLQIGQTGKVVTPDVYIACGISGAIQHLAGMSQSRVIIAINKDPDAPIFQVADYGIVGDLFEVVPLLTAELKKARG